MDYARQLDIISPDQLRDVHLTGIGAGGIGSPTVMALTKMGLHDITIYDDDSIEVHNLPNQMYRLKDLGRLKVDALSEICKEYSGIQIITNAEKYFNQPLDGLVFSGVDSMNQREIIWKNIKNNVNVSIYIDGRMGGEVSRILTIKPCDPADIEFYESTLYKDEEAQDLPCTARAIIYNVFTIASFITSKIKKVVRGEEYYRDLIIDLKTTTLIAVN